ncbi:MAG: TrmB family transcriptional regulator [Eubacterium sp.]|jgi:sugar-specific transcriptional regulator TrmB|nr:TrmB family transcriptional regulator [Eubacterium sp.]
MDTNYLIESLMCFGLTRQEATVYLCLSQNGGMTGYEAAKQTGISRSNAYGALAGLVEKGAAYTTEDAAVRYYAVVSDEFCANKIHTLEELKKQLHMQMPAPKIEAEGYITITGDTHIQDKARNMVDGAKERVYLSMTAGYVSFFEDVITKASKEGKKTVLLTDKPLVLPEVVVYETGEKGKQIGVIADSAYVLTGEFGRGQTSRCLYTGQPNFVQVFKDSMRNEIKLVQILKGEKGREEKTICNN